MSWDIHSNGLLVIAYDLNNNGKADFFTLRVIIKSFNSTETVSEMEGHFPGNLVFNVAYEQDTHYYIINKNPLFYAIDLNEDGVWDLLYKDELEDGVNGNEQFYESPSGMFTRDAINELK